MLTRTRRREIRAGFSRKGRTVTAGGADRSENLDLAKAREDTATSAVPMTPDAGADASPLAATVLLAENAQLKQALADAERKIAELEARADEDPLLGLLNRRGFERELTRSLAYVKRYGTGAALMFIDLDDFKPVNDRYGHVAGDAVLKAVAGALIGHVRASDVVARLGGDEFCVLLWNVADAAALAKAAEIEAVIAALRVDYAGAELLVGASAGIAMLVADAAPSDVIDAADRAMYARKNAKRH
ncbi:MAG: diguanylate cyclase [Rhodopseudomonas sp.]|nr:diguanylate cyclase [Rhodopseudomonas sp.]